MSKITSWDGRSECLPQDGTPYTSVADAMDSKPVRVRIVAWPEGAPDPSTVPHAGEPVSNCGDTGVVVSGIPERGRKPRNRNRWGLQVRRDDGGDQSTLWFLDMTCRIPDAPTIEIGGNRYRESDVIARCAELEEV